MVGNADQIELETFIELVVLSDKDEINYSIRNLYNMGLLYEKVQTVSAKLSWSHYSLILSFENNKMAYYIKVCERENISVREIKYGIKTNEFGKGYT